MPSLFTDDVRERRYAALRKQKKRLDRLYDILMFVALIYGLAQMILLAFDFLMNGIILGHVRTMPTIFLFMLAAASTIYVLSLKTKKSALFAELLTLLCFALTSASTSILPYLIIGIGSMILAHFWEKLSEEEGFPLFQISFREMDERRSNAEKRTHFQAALLGERQARAEQVAAIWNDSMQQHIQNKDTLTKKSNEMSDLLELNGNVPIERLHLQQYHDRSRNDLRETPELKAETQEIMQDVTDFQPNQTSQTN